MIRSIVALPAIGLVGLAQAQRILPLGTGVIGYVNTLTVYNDELIVGGLYSSFNGNPRRNIQAWSASGHNTMPGAFAGTATWVDATAVYDGHLIAGGTEPQFGHIAKWDGAQWSSLGGGFGSRVRAMTVRQNELIACGDGGLIRAWNGTQWTTLLEHGSGTVWSVTDHDGILHAGTSFPPYLMRLVNGQWQPVVAGLNGAVEALLSKPEGLYAAGGFTIDGQPNASFIVRVSGNDAFALEGVAPMSGIRRLIPWPGTEAFIASGVNESFTVGGSMHASWLPGGIRTMAAYQGGLVVGGTFSYSRFQWVKGLGRVVPGSDIAVSDIGDIGATATATGILFNDTWSWRKGFEAPIGSGRHAFFSVSPWIMGLDGDSLHGTCALYDADPLNAPWMIGPAEAMPDSARVERFGQVWKHDRYMIQDHSAHYSDAGYTPRHELASYPGNRPGSEERLAPYYDLDGNGQYDPAQGDYPIIRGDQSIYRLLNDLQPVPPSGFRPMGMELHIAQSAFHSPWTPALHDLVLTSFRFVNRSDRSYHGVRFGLMLDFDIGLSDDDVTGCDTLLHAAFGYNAQPFDPDGLNYPGYGSHPPAAGCVFLNSPMRSFITLNRANSSMTDPSVPVEFYHLLLGSFPDGSPILDPEGNLTTYIYHGDPNTPGGWTSPPPTPAQPDIRTVAATGPFSIAPGDTLCFDLGFVFAQDSAGNHLSSVALLKQRIAELRAWYAHQEVRCDGSNGLDTRVPEMPMSTRPVIFPNPADRSTTIRLPAGTRVRHAQLHDAEGRLLETRIIPATDSSFMLNTAHLAAGLYHVRFTGGAPIPPARFMVAH